MQCMCVCVYVCSVCVVACDCMFLITLKPRGVGSSTSCCAVFSQAIYLLSVVVWPVKPHGHCSAADYGTNSFPLIDSV